MAKLQEKPRTTAHAIGELCMGGDWACAHGDLSTLGHISRCLADYTRNSLHRELLVLAELCHHDPELATAAWFRLKELVQHSGG